MANEDLIQKMSDLFGVAPSPINGVLYKRLITLGVTDFEEAPLDRERSYFIIAGPSEVDTVLVPADDDVAMESFLGMVEGQGMSYEEAANLIVNELGAIRQVYVPDMAETYFPNGTAENIYGEPLENGIEYYFVKDEESNTWDVVPIDPECLLTYVDGVFSDEEEEEDSALDIVNATMPDSNTGSGELQVLEQIYCSKK